MRGFLGGIVVVALALVLMPVAVLAFGWINMAATQRPGAIEKAIASFAVEQSVSARASDVSVSEDSLEVAEHAVEHFQTCVLCHGAPGVEPAEFASGLNPPAPELSEVHQEWSDAELYWIVKHGIRMTGMPAFGKSHSDEELWQLVAFVRHLPELEPEERKKLESSRRSGAHASHNSEKPDSIRPAKSAAGELSHEHQAD